MKSKKSKKILLCSLVFTLSVPRYVYAEDYLCKHKYHTMNDHHLISIDGLWSDERYFYYRSGVADYTRGTISSGFCEWNVASRTLQLKEVKNEDDANILVKKGTLGSGIYGTTGYTTENICEYQTKNYKKAIITLDFSNAGTSGNLLKKVATHEAGHALGFTHVTGEKSVMYPHANNALAASHLQLMDESLVHHVYGILC